MHILLLTEIEKQDRLIHAAFTLPNGVTPVQAERDAEAAREEAKKDEGWNYDDVFRLLRLKGYERCNIVQSVE